MKKLLKSALLNCTLIRTCLSSIRLIRIAQKAQTQIKIKRVKGQVIWLAKLSLQTNSNPPTCKLNISDCFGPGDPGSRRLLECLKYWLPLTSNYCRTRGISGTFSFCSDDTDTSHHQTFNMDGTNIQWLIPDLFSLQESGNWMRPEQVETLEAFAGNWAKRPFKMFWRGSTTGQGRITSLNQLQSIQRIAICRQFNGHPGINLKISNINCLPSIRREAEDLLRAQGAWGEAVDESMFGNAKYYPDIPGNALAWGTIRKYLRGCLIFKPESERELYYYRLIKPWIHFIPVKSNFSDLHEKFIWAENNPRQATTIAWRGKQFATEYLHNIKDHFNNALEACNQYK